MELKNAKLSSLADLLIYYGILVFCATIPFSIALATGGLFGGAFGWILRCALDKKIAWRSSPLDGVILVFLVLQVFSILFSIDWIRSANKLRSYWHLLPFALLIQSRLSEKRIHKVLRILIASGVLSAILGIGQYLLASYGSSGDATIRISGTFGMYMTYAGILSLIWAVALFQFADESASRVERTFYLAALLVIGCALILSMTRIALVAMITVGLVLLVLRTSKIFAALAGTVVLMILLVPGLKQSAHSVIWGTQTPSMDTNVMIPWAEQRPYLWKGAYRIIKAHPWTGVGLGNFRNAYKEHLPYDLKKTYNHAHNNFLQIGAETGLPGLAAFILLNLAAFWFLLRATWKNPNAEAKAVLGGVLAAFLGFHAAGMFEFNFGDSEVALVFWGLLGFAVLATKVRIDACCSRS